MLGITVVATEEPAGSFYLFPEHQTSLAVAFLLARGGIMKKGHEPDRTCAVTAVTFLGRNRS